MFSRSVFDVLRFFLEFPRRSFRNSDPGRNLAFSYQMHRVYISYERNRNADKCTSAGVCKQSRAIKLHIAGFRKYHISAQSELYNCTFTWFADLHLSIPVPHGPQFIVTTSMRLPGLHAVLLFRFHLAWVQDIAQFGPHVLVERFLLSAACINRIIGFAAWPEGAFFKWGCESNIKL